MIFWKFYKAHSSKFCTQLLVCMFFHSKNSLTPKSDNIPTLFFVQANIKLVLIKYSTNIDNVVLKSVALLAIFSGLCFRSFSTHLSLSAFFGNFKSGTANNIVPDHSWAALQLVQCETNHRGPACNLVEKLKS